MLCADLVLLYKHEIPLWKHRTQSKFRLPYHSYALFFCVAEPWSSMHLRFGHRAKLYLLELAKQLCRQKCNAGDMRNWDWGHWAQPKLTEDALT